MTIVGDPGIGKTRLLRVFAESVAAAAPWRGPGTAAKVTGSRRSTRSPAVGGYAETIDPRRLFTTTTRRPAWR